jgi:hypothetical protein
MKTSTTHSKHPRPLLARFGKIAAASAFVLLIGAFAIGPVQADEHHGGDHDRGRGHQERHEYRGHGYYRGPDIVYSAPDYYYAPAPDYYAEPDPYDYGYYPPERRYYPPQPSEGIHLFFGF